MQLKFAKKLVKFGRGSQVEEWPESDGAIVRLGERQ
jgi:hypothetical protein